MTITEHVLLEIARARIPIIAIDKTTLPEEAEIGADWEWWIGSGSHWWRFAVQAKKLSSEHYSYEELRHMIERKKPQKSELQFEVLKRYARCKSAIPLYALYNHYPPANTDHWHCQTNNFTTGEQDQFGCTLAPLERIGEVISPNQRRTFKKVHIRFTQLANSVPWRCLFHRACMGGAVAAPGAAHPLAGAEFNHIRTRQLPRVLQTQLATAVPISHISADELDEDDYPSDMGSLESVFTLENGESVQEYYPRLYPAFIFVIDIRCEGLCT